jgi:hypothetical protein
MRSPVGAAWIGTFQGLFESHDGGPPEALWSIEEALVGGPVGIDGLLSYVQPACDAILGGGHENDYLVTTSDLASPTTDDTVMWSIGPGDRVALMFPDLDTPLSIYSVETLDAARELVLSGEMPPGLEFPPSAWPDCPTGPTPRPVSDPEDSAAAMSALQSYFDDIAAGRLREAWERLSPDTQAKWGSFEAFAPDPGEVVLSEPIHEPDMRCSWVAEAADLGDADLSRVYIIAATSRDDLDRDRPGAPYIRPDAWAVAPLPDGTWRLWQVR